MNLQLVPVDDGDLQQYKINMQEAFQKGYEEEFGQTEEEILPEEDSDRSMNANGSVAYKALVDGKMVGGAIVVINSDTQHNHLDFLFVNYGIQSKGIGKANCRQRLGIYVQAAVFPATYSFSAFLLRFSLAQLTRPITAMIKYILLFVR